MVAVSAPLVAHPYLNLNAKDMTHNPKNRECPLEHGLPNPAPCICNADHFEREKGWDAPTWREFFEEHSLSDAVHEVMTRITKVESSAIEKCLTILHDELATAHTTT